MDIFRAILMNREGKLLNDLVIFLKTSHKRKQFVNKSICHIFLTHISLAAGPSQS